MHLPRLPAARGFGRLMPAPRERAGSPRSPHGPRNHPRAPNPARAAGMKRGRGAPPARAPDRSAVAPRQGRPGRPDGAAGLGARGWTRRAGRAARCGALPAGGEGWWLAARGRGAAGGGRREGRGRAAASRQNAGGGGTVRDGTGRGRAEPRRSLAGPPCPVTPRLSASPRTAPGRGTRRAASARRRPKWRPPRRRARSCRVCPSAPAAATTATPRR